MIFENRDKNSIIKTSLWLYNSSDFKFQFYYSRILTTSILLLYDLVQTCSLKLKLDKIKLNISKSYYLYVKIRYHELF